MDALRVGSSDSVGVLVPLRRNEQGRGEHQIEGGEATSNHEKTKGKAHSRQPIFFLATTLVTRAGEDEVCRQVLSNLRGRGEGS